MQEFQPIKRDDEVLPHVETLGIERASALEQVLARFRLPFRVVAREGAPYPDGNSKVPKGEVFVTYDTGEVPTEVVWRMVNEISPLPTEGR